ncbi:MAG: hypothetical protein ACFCGT_00075 [Sandaracinaceae bacterium]
MVQTALRMVREGVIIQGGCFGYIDEVFDRAGYGPRERRTVHRRSLQGPYVDLDRVRPGDWLLYVNHPERTPIGTHSVIFLGWEDRRAGRARVVTYRGNNTRRPGDLRVYEISRVYGIVRAVAPEA